MKSKYSIFPQLLFTILSAVSCTPENLKYDGLSAQVTVTTSEVSTVTQTSALSGVQVVSAFSDDIQHKGICYSLTAMPTINNTTVGSSGGSGALTLSLNNLTPGTTYYCRAYAATSRDVIYGSARSFTTLFYQLPTVTTAAVGTTTQTTSICGGTVSGAGGGNVTGRGVCWSTVPNPTTASNRTSDGSGTGSFSSSLNGLTPKTLYYVRAYATNQAGTAYGGSASFTTSPVQLATLTTPVISGIARNSAIGSASATADGGGPISTRGICWSSSTSLPSPGNSSFLSGGSGTGSMSLTMTSLITGTTYYIRAYATNAAGTSYSNTVSFRTP